MEKKIDYMFFIHVKRNCKEWEGEVEWLSDGQTESFSTVLEMIRIIDQRIGNNEVPLWNTKKMEK